MKNFMPFLLMMFFLASGCSQQKQEKQSNEFSFVFATDIHLTDQRNSTEGYLRAIHEINLLAPDFVITGGDNIMDALGETLERSDSLIRLFKKTSENLEMPIYTTMGNHEIFGLNESSGVSPDNEFYGKKLYEERFTDRYYSFDHKNWHFIVLDGMNITDDRNYFGVVDSVQVEWLINDLEKKGNETPVVIVTHIPLLSIGNEIMQGPTRAFNRSSIITNGQEIIKILEQYNVKLVLQGHLHFLEDINYNGIHYITGGAVSANWWNGPRFGMEEGFVKVDVVDDDFEWKYVDFGWEPNP